MKQRAYCLFHEHLETRRVYDEAGLIPKSTIERYEQHLRMIYRESDIDVRIYFLKDTQNKTLEKLAVEKFDQLRIGANSREERGVLLLYNPDEKELRIEVGYGLEGYFPDSFVGYLMNFHARDTITSGDVTTGFRLLIRMLHYRIREEILGTNFDPTVIEKIEHKGHLSGGGGVTDRGSDDGLNTSNGIPILSVSERQYYTPQETPEAAYFKYLEWLIEGIYDPNIELFTPKSQKYLARLPMTRAYLHWMVLREYGKKYKIAIKDKLAMQYFVDSPLVTPHFFTKGKRGWQMDMVSEVALLKNRIGGVFAWDYDGRSDPYTKAFIDKFVNIKGYIRISDGDNRELPIRGDL